MTGNPESLHPQADFPVLILGAGFSGIGMGIKLKEAGIENFTILEREDEVGGTWRDNTYPNAGCDVHSHLYSFSFEPNPDWSRAFSGWKEILDYIKSMTDRHGLRSHIEFNKTVNSAVFDEDSGLWTVKTTDGSRYVARAVVSAAGGLSNPAYPDIPGLDSFKGEIVHTARWDNSMDLAGKRVAMIGSGASAIQTGPGVAPKAKQLSVFQRTPSWIINKPDRKISAAEKMIYRNIPGALKLRRWMLYWMYESRGPLIISDKPWAKKILQGLALRHMKSQIKDRALQKACTPDYQIGCKRILISNDWYPMLTRDNVSLVTEGIESINERGIVTTDGTEHPCDVIILATGFKVSISNAPFHIEGRDGQTLEQAWAGGAEAYKGMTVSGFPNLYFMLGPNTGPGHNSVLVYTEMQIDYALQGIKLLGRRNLKYIDVKKPVQDRFNEEIQGRMENTAWTSGCKSWYVSEDGKNSTLYPGLNIEYRLRTRRLRPSEYEQAPMRETVS